MEVENETIVSGDLELSPEVIQEEEEDNSLLDNDEKKELDELRKKDELKRDFVLFDEELKRKLKRNVKTVSGESAPNYSEVETQVFERLKQERKKERDEALQDFLSQNASEYVTEETRIKLLEEVDQYKGTDNASYRDYTKLLENAHRVIGVPRFSKTDKNVKECNEERANYAGGLKAETRRETSGFLTPLQKNIIKKMGIKEDSYL